MCRSGPLKFPKAARCVRLLPPASAIKHPPSLRKVARRQRSRILAARILTIFAACVGALLAANIVIEAFDDDLDLWPFGAEDSALAPQHQLVTGGQPFSALFALNAIQCLVTTAGAYLVLRHRARGALPTDRPSVSVAFNVAEH